MIHSGSPDMIQTEPGALNCFWRLPEVENRTGLGRSTIYRRVRRGEFPAPRDLGGRASAWWADDVMTWMRSRPVATASRLGYRAGTPLAAGAGK